MAKETAVLSAEQQATVGVPLKDRPKHVQTCAAIIVAAGLKIGDTKVDDAYLVNLSDGRIESAASKYAGFMALEFIGKALNAKDNPVHAAAMGLVMGEINSEVGGVKKAFEKDSRFFSNVFPRTLEDSKAAIEEVIAKIGPIVRGIVRSFELLQTAGVTVGGTPGQTLLMTAALGSGFKGDKKMLASSTVQGLSRVHVPTDKNGNVLPIGEAIFAE